MYIEISPSNRATCQGCGKKISIGTPRGVYERTYSNHLERFFICYNCLPKAIQDEIRATEEEYKQKLDSLKKLPEELKEEMEKNAKAIVIAELK
jgi:hypothetical protein